MASSASEASGSDEHDDGTDDQSYCRQNGWSHRPRCWNVAKTGQTGAAHPFLREPVTLLKTGEQVHVRCGAATRARGIFHSVRIITFRPFAREKKL